METQPVGGIRRIVTDHNESGKAFVKYDDEQPLLDLTPEHATFSVSQARLDVRDWLTHIYV